MLTVYRDRALPSLVMVLQFVMSAGCDQINCPSGTKEVQGQCVRDNDDDDSSRDRDTDGFAEDGVTIAGSSGSGPLARGSASAGDGTNGSGNGFGGTSSASANGAGTAGAGGDNAAANGGTPNGGAGMSGGSAAGGAADGGARAGMSSNSSCSSETCDNLDNDCDQKIDEEVTRSCGPAMMGACKPGTETCAAGMWSGMCDGSIEPKMEVCDVDGVDENCDGAANENCDCTPGMTQPCGMMVGICKQGTQTCDDRGQWSTECAGAVTPDEEVCDGSKDEDCDQKVDEDCDCTNGEKMDCGVDVGECAMGTKTCTDGKWGSTCQGERKPGTESCDGKDNDCDGESDEGLLNECGGCSRLNNPPGSSCSAGENACQVSGRYECSGRDATTCDARARPSLPEFCDNADNDCDGDADEGLENDCGGSCRTRLAGEPGDSCNAGSGSCSVPGTWECAGSNVRCVSNCWYLCVRGTSAAVRTQDPCGWGGAGDPDAACVPENPSCS